MIARERKREASGETLLHPVLDHAIQCMGGVPQEQKILKRHLPRVLCHRVYSIYEDKEGRGITWRRARGYDAGRAEARKMIARERKKEASGAWGSAANGGSSARSTCVRGGGVMEGCVERLRYM